MKIKKQYYSWSDVETMCTDIVLQMYKDNWRPDYIVGLTRGGNIPATIISNMLDVKCEALKVSFRDDEECESNCWMAEDASNGQNILIIDDINDTGRTLNWIKEDWHSSVFNMSNEVWGSNVRFAVFTNNLASEFDDVNYFVHEVNKAEEDVWLVYPWEVVGKV